MIPPKPQISRIEMHFLDRVFQMESGYVLNFSDRTFSQFFAEELRVDIDNPRFAVNGGSKGKRLRTYLQIVEPHQAAAALRALWDYRCDMFLLASTPEPLPEAKAKLTEILVRLDANGDQAKTDAIEAFASDETLNELIQAIERDVSADKPQVALDRLHTYCMKKFAHLLESRGETVSGNDSLNARAGRYFNPLRRDGKCRPISDKIMKSTVEMLELFNHIRNNESLAHDNKLIEANEARFIFDAIVNMLRFLKSIEGKAFE